MANRDELVQHINDQKTPAETAAEETKWAKTVDFLAASKLYKVNIFVCSDYPGAVKTGQKSYWQRYSPKMSKSVINSIHIFK
jgi:hypothetical protein